MRNLLGWVVLGFAIVFALPLIIVMAVIRLEWRILDALTLTPDHKRFKL